MQYLLEILQTVLLVVILWRIARNNIAGSNQRPFSTTKRRIILDSCALIDGRIAAIAGRGFISDELVIPQFIINELQLLADGNDSQKRERARFGLDIAHQLQDSALVTVNVDHTELNGPTGMPTDDKLVLLAKKMQAQLYTTDYNLSKVAVLEGVKVLNVNELAHDLRPVTLPGELLTIKIIQRGSSQGQGVGYLDDGTMIVVDGAAGLVGKTVPVSVTRMHQTVAGKMVFGQLQKTAEGNQRQREPQKTVSQQRPQAKLYDRLHGSPRNVGRERRRLS